MRINKFNTNQKMAGGTEQGNEMRKREQTVVGLHNGKRTGGEWREATTFRPVVLPRVLTPRNQE